VTGKKKTRSRRERSAPRGKECCAVYGQGEKRKKEKNRQTQQAGEKKDGNSTGVPTCLAKKGRKKKFFVGTQKKKKKGGKRSHSGLAGEIRAKREKIRPATQYWKR